LQGEFLAKTQSSAKIAKRIAEFEPPPPGLNCLVDLMMKKHFMDAGRFADVTSRLLSYEQHKDDR
jgi:hypothetical protein